MGKVFQRLTFNLGGPVIRQETLNGIDYTVVPTNMLAEGVWEGSGGKVLYLGEELSKSAPAWNHKPLVIYHPKSVDGKPISACEPNVLNTRACGLILNSKYDDKLRTEAWIDPKRADAIDRRVMKAINSRQVIECSTGLWSDNEDASGEFNGKPYDVIARNYLPDHLAILPDKVGAYPASAGGGMLQINAASTDPESMQEAYLNSLKRFLATSGLQWTNNELSYSAIGRQLHDLIATKYGKPGKYFQGSIHEIFKNRIVFGMDDGEPGLYMLQYEVKGDEVQLKGSATKVKQVVKYQANDSEAYAGNESGDLVLVTQEERMSFNKKDHLASLKAGGWSDAELVELDKLPDSILEGVRPKTDESPASKLIKNEGKKDEETEETPTPTVKAQTWDEIIANAAPEVQSMLEDMKESQDEQRAALINEITTNAKLGGVKFKDGYLDKKPTKELRLMAALAKGHAKPKKKSIENSDEEDFILPQGPANFVGNAGADEEELTTNEEEGEESFSGPVAPKMFKINDDMYDDEEEPAPKKNKRKAV